ncbi:unnamed protein product, partial [Phaeothamnion confervicola]
MVLYCEQSYLTPGASKPHVRGQTELYLRDALESVVKDIQTLAMSLSEYIDSQGRVLDVARSDVCGARDRLLLQRDQAAVTRLSALRPRVEQPLALEKIVKLRGEEMPERCRGLGKQRRVPIAARLESVYGDWGAGGGGAAAATAAAPEAVVEARPGSPGHSDALNLPMVGLMAGGRDGVPGLQRAHSFGTAPSGG